MKTGLLGDPLRRGSPGTPTLLSFQQLLKVKAIQELRLDVSLQEIRRVVAWLLDHLFVESWEGLTFKVSAGDVFITAGTDVFRVPGGQLVLGLGPSEIGALESALDTTRLAWDERVLAIRGYPYIVSDPGVQGGSPTVVGTRIETALLAVLARDEETENPVADILSTYRWLKRDHVVQALRFEGVSLAA